MLRVLESFPGAFGLALQAVKSQEFGAPEIILHDLCESSVPEIESSLCQLMPVLVVWIAICCPTTGIEFAFAVEIYAFVAYETDA